MIILCLKIIYAGSLMNVLTLIRCYKEVVCKHSMKNKFAPDPTFATSPICITDPEFDFSVDLSLISTVEADPFYERENDDAIAHLTKLTELGWFVYY